MTAIKKYPIIQFIGVPIIGTVLILLARQIDLFAILRFELLFAFGYIAAVLDLKAKKIPNTLILAMLVSWVLIIMPKLFIDTDIAIGFIVDSIIGMATGGGIFLLMYVISHKGLGGGDVKYMAAIGLYIGFSGTLTVMLCGTIFAALIGLVLILLKKIGRKDSIPLAPFLYAGILIAVFFS